jgi:TRAP-type uncharacterized transport system fused permease subunit
MELGMENVTWKSHVYCPMLFLCMWLLNEAITLLNYWSNNRLILMLWSTNNFSFMTEYIFERKIPRKEHAHKLAREIIILAGSLLLFFCLYPSSRSVHWKIKVHQTFFSYISLAYSSFCICDYEKNRRWKRAKETSRKKSKYTWLTTRPSVLWQHAQSNHQSDTKRVLIDFLYHFTPLPADTDFSRSSDFETFL